MLLDFADDLEACPNRSEKMMGFIAWLREQAAGSNPDITPSECVRLVLEQFFRMKGCAGRVVSWRVV